MRFARGSICAGAAFGAASSAAAAAIVGGPWGVSLALATGAFTYLALAALDSQLFRAGTPRGPGSPDTAPPGAADRRTRLRRSVQAAAFVFFLALAGPAPGRPGALPSLSPFLAATGSLASRSILAATWPALVVVASALLLGRAFCGWICPLGTTIDAADRLLRPLRVRERRASIRLKYWILLAAVVSSATGSAFLAGLSDPLAIASRGLLGPARGLGSLVLRAERAEAREGPRAGALVVGAGPLGGTAALAAMTLGVLLLGFLARRTWCRTLCPLGACLGLVGRWSLARRRVLRECRACGACRDACPMGCIAEDGRVTVAGECILCTGCSDACAATGRTDAPAPGRGAIRFWPSAGGEAGSARTEGQVPRGPGLEAAEGLSRRAFAASAVAGLALAPILRAFSRGRGLVRPPGALRPEEFAERCLRCGACASVCPTGTIRVSWLEGGPEGLLTPRLVPRSAPCDPDCAACGAACPSGAIRPLSLEEKRLTAVGIAVIDRSRCIPWAAAGGRARDAVRANGGPRGCLLCEEYCPVPGKAIALRRAEGGEPLLLPYVLPDRCNGCGVCENVCPVGGESAIRIEGFEEQIRLHAPHPLAAGPGELLPSEDDLPGWRLVEGPREPAPGELGVPIPDGSCEVAVAARYAIGQAAVELVVCLAADEEGAARLFDALEASVKPVAVRAEPPSSGERRAAFEGGFLALSGRRVAIARADAETGATSADAETVAAAALARQ